MTLIKLGFDKKDTRNRLEDLAAGAIAGSAANFAVAPIDAIKDVQKMNQNANANARAAISLGKMNAADYHEVPEKLRSVAKTMWTAEKGIKNKFMRFYRGSGTALLKIAPMAALQFMLYGLVKEKLQRKDK